MRVLFVCPNLQAGGAERHWSILLPRLRARGFDVRVLTIDGRGPFYDALASAGVPAATAADSGRLRELIATRAMLRSGADLLVSRAVSAERLSLLARTIRGDARWVVNWHHPAGMALAPRRRLILGQTLKRADAVVAVSPSQLPDLRALGVRPEAVRVIPNGTDFRPTPEERDATRTELGLTPGAVAFLLVGRLEAQKRVDRFIDAIATASASDSEIIGLIAGAGPHQEALQRQIASTRAPVTLLGRRDDMPRILAAADALCLASDYEALPFVVLEAMASGLPVIASAVGGLPDVVRDGVSGVLVAADDRAALVRAIATLAADPERRRAMGRSGRSIQLDLYDAEVMADSYATALEQISGSSPTRTRRRSAAGTR